MSENLPPNPPPPPPAAPVPPSGAVPPVEPRGLALSAMIVGIASLVLGFVISFIGLLGGIAALILGILGLKKRQHKGMSLTGIITGSIAIVVSIIAIIIAIFVVGAILSDPTISGEF